MKALAELLEVFRNYSGRIVDGFDDSVDGGAVQFGPLCIVASWGGGWDHVSVSRQDRVPTWEEMCKVKRWFFHNHEAAMQLHPPESEYVNNHSRCLHMWRPNDGTAIPLPPSEYVGLKSVGVLT